MSSPLSFMLGGNPTGWGDFMAGANPRGVYGLNHHASGLETIYRRQDDTWDRLPDACQTPGYWEVHDPIQVARYELLTKRQWIPKRGNLNLIEIWKLDPSDWYAWYNEPVIGQGDDRFARANWWMMLSIEGMKIAEDNGLNLCVGSFCTGEPPLDTIPHFAPMFRYAKENGHVVDVHEYGVDGYLMINPTGTSGALHYRQIWNALPAEAQCDFVVSEFWSHSGFTSSGNWRQQIEDARLYGLEIVKDWPRLRWASAFQLDQGKENNFTAEAIEAYEEAARGIVQNETPPSPPPQPKIITIDPTVSVRVLNITPSTANEAILLIPQGYTVTQN